MHRGFEEHSGIVDASTFIRTNLEKWDSRTFIAHKDSRKDCPPCWQCRYFDGWLPASEPRVKTHRIPEMQAALQAIDKRKIAVAQWVRSKGMEDFTVGGD